MQLSKRFLATALVLLTLNSVTAKIYERCELANELRYQYNVPVEDVGVWVCIAGKQSNYDSRAMSQDFTAAYYGLFKISNQYWCSPPGNGLACGINCRELQDDYIGDDFKCTQRIFEEHQRLSGNGFNAWPIYQQFCRWNAGTYIQGCFGISNGNQVQPYHAMSPLSTSSKSHGKVFERCELARELRDKHNIPMEQIGTWVCIAKHESNFNTSAVGRLNYDGSEDHGLFQISDIYWCSPPGTGWVCGLSCNKLEDNDITDDVNCMRKIHEEHTRLSGDGFNAWTVYPGQCRGRSEQYVKGCFDDDDNENTVIPPTEQTTLLPKQRKQGTGKVFERCELAKELRTKHKVPTEQIATWVCIAQHESNFNTSAIGSLNADGSGDHGLFQISDIYWCSPPGNGRACGLSCAQLENDDISDDVKCMMKIYEEHQRLSGDGFNAWTVYGPHCKQNAERYVQSCFEDDENEVIPFVPRPGITGPPIDKKPLRTSVTPSGKVYERCELANELKNKHKISMEQLATWVCIAQHESNYNTSAVGSLNADGSGDHGLFQISDIYWCSPPGNGRACGLTCSELEDNDISDDVKCMLKIYDEHQRLSGDGFNAWAVYGPHCKQNSEKYIQNCFDESDNEIVSFAPRPGIVAPSRPRPNKTPLRGQEVKKTGKVYERCELARELRDVHGFPENEVATWVCIANHESRFDTSAIGRLNADGSEDHGLFQISDIYWCSPPGRGTGCGLTCVELEDDDISDDVECIRTIHDEHTLISGDGYTAWAVYNPHCRGNVESFIRGCFEETTTTSPKMTTTTKSTTWRTSTQKKTTTMAPTTTRKMITSTLRTTTSPKTTTAPKSTTWWTQKKTSTTAPTTTRKTTTTSTSRPTTTTKVTTKRPTTTEKTLRSTKTEITRKETSAKPQFNIFDFYLKRGPHSTTTYRSVVSFKSDFTTSTKAPITFYSPWKTTQKVTSRYMTSIMTTTSKALWKTPQNSIAKAVTKGTTTKDFTTSRTTQRFISTPKPFISSATKSRSIRSTTQGPISSGSRVFLKDGAYNLKPSDFSYVSQISRPKTHYQNWNNNDLKAAASVSSLRRPSDTRSPAELFDQIFDRFRHSH